MSAPRIAILGPHLEASAFAPPTTRDDFERQCWEEGEAITRLAREVSHLPSELPGSYARMDATGPWTPVPVLVASAPPGGPIEQALFLDFCDRVRNGLAAALPVDALYVPSHGASSATGDEDSDGTLLAMARQIVGPAMPIVVSHDLHCNVSERLVQACDALVVYRTNPHVDVRERAAESADLLREILSGTRTAKAFLRLPLTPPSVTLLTAEGSYADLMRYDSLPRRCGYCCWPRTGTRPTLRRRFGMWRSRYRLSSTPSVQTRAAAPHLSDRVPIMYPDHIVAAAPAEEVIARPNALRTQAALAEVPRIEAPGELCTAFDARISILLGPPSD
jgi:Metallopeptidase family M81